MDGSPSSSMTTGSALASCTWNHGRDRGQLALAEPQRRDLGVVGVAVGGRERAEGDDGVE